MTKLYTALWACCLGLLPLAGLAQVQTPTTLAPIGIAAVGNTYTQDFSVLVGSGTSSTLPAGWGFSETGSSADNTYSASTGSTGVGNTYSFGYSLSVNGASDRAFGSVLSSTLAATVGVAFQNNTGSTIDGLTIEYRGEQWRNGNPARVAADRLDFQYLVGGSSLSSGSYLDYDALDFSSLVYNTNTTAVMLDGNATGNFQMVRATIPVSLAPGATIYLRWVDYDAPSGNDDALGIDDVKVTAVQLPAVTTATPTVANAGTTVGGTVASAGTAGTVTGRGVVYSTTNATPALGGSGVSAVAAGSGLGTFSTTLTGLTRSTTYYVAAYATNDDGTSYGAITTFVSGSGVISLSTLDVNYPQDFNTLARTGSMNPKATVPTGWDFVETGTGADELYSATASVASNTYSLGGTSTALDRTFGTGHQRADGMLSTIGATFVNNTGQAITGLVVQYTGEQWRIGSARSTPVVDRLDFQYSLDATALNNGTFTDVDALDFTSRVTTSASSSVALDGNDAANRQTLSATIPVTVPAGGTIVIRWLDFDANIASNDVLGVDDFSIKPILLPTVSTASPVVANAGTTVGGTVTSAGSQGTVTGRGVVYSATNATPTLGGTDATAIAVGSGLGAFSTVLTGLTRATTYYVTAYVTNADGTSYGAVTTFVPGSGAISVSTLGTAYTQNFDTSLLNTGSANSKLTVPAGWDFIEALPASGPGTSAPDDTYSAVASNTGNTYSLGTVGSADRAFGTVQNSGVLPTIGALFTNNTGQTISSVTISYTGELWRVGTIGRADRLEFEYSTNATDVLTGTYTAVPALHFSSPSNAATGATDGNDAANRTALTATIPVSIAPGGTLYIRWNDINVTGTDDALGVDDFSLTASAAPLPVELTEFTATTTGSATQLAWRTASERNSARFAVERSPDGHTFETLHQVAAQGSTSQATRYAWLDAKLPASATVLYYRLRQVDLDGTTAYSPVRTVQRAASEAAASFVVYPTVITDNQLRYVYQGTALDACSLEIYSFTGQLLSQYKVGATAATVPVGGLPTGWYVARLRTANSQGQAKFYVP